MDSDMDLFDDLTTQPAVTRGRAGGKFQPRAKPRQTKGTTDVLGKESEERSSISKSAREAGFSRVDKGSQDNALPASDSIDEAGEEFQPLVKMQSEKETSALESVSQSNTLKEQSAVQSSSDAGAIELVIPIDEANKSIHPDGESAMEVDSMGVHIDPFGDILPEPAASTTRAGTKFQPRAKAIPRKGTSMAIASAVSNAPVENALGFRVSDNMQSAKPVVGDNEVVNPSTSLLTTTKRIGMGNMGSHILAVDSPSAEVVIGDMDSRMRKSVVENADIFSGLECIDEAITQGTSGTDISAPVPHARGPEEKFNIDAKSSFNYLAMEGDVATLDPVHCEAVVHKDYKNSELEASGVFHDLEDPENFCEAATESDIRMDEEETGIAEPSCSDDADALHSKDASGVPENESCGGRTKRTSSIMHLPQKHKPSYVSDEMNEGGITKQATGQLADEAACDGVESPSHHVADQEDYDYEPAVDEDGEGDVCRVENTSKKKQTSTKAKRNVSNKEKSVQNCKRAKGAVEQTTQECPEKFSSGGLPEDEAYDNDGTGSPSSHVPNEEGFGYELAVYEDGENYVSRVENASKKMLASIKSKKPVAGKEKSVRKRKRGNGVEEQTAEERPKKFSHSTRRNRRRVNKELLDMPEDEIDFQMLPIRDIILLAEHKERTAIKEAKTASVTTERTDNTFHRDNSRDEDDPFALEQDGSFADEQAYTQLADEQVYTQQATLSLFNHHSFMNKAPAARWSKQDTELFYEAVRQFGTDLSMIQQLFPGRTRHEIKLKFKKEERQHPLRFRDAQSHRSTDYSFFKKVIERLQDGGTPPDQEPKKEGSNSATVNEEAALDAETNEQVAKSEVDEDGAAEDQETYVNEVQDNMQYDEINEVDYGDVWDSYKSDF